MKQLKFFSFVILFIGSVFLFSSAQNSKSVGSDQIFIHGTDIRSINKDVNYYLIRGYRIKLGFSQSVSTAINVGNQYCNVCYESDHRDIKGEIIIVMEK